MQQYVHRVDATTRKANVAVAHAQRRTLSRFERSLALVLLWILAALIFVVTAISIAFSLQHFGVDAKYAELLLGLSYFPLYLIVRKGWITARRNLLATEIDAFLATHGIKT